MVFWAFMTILSMTHHVVVTNSVAVAKKTITQGTIIGGGRIGGLLHSLNGGKDTLITRESDEKIHAGVESAPIYVCTRNNDLEQIINDCPEDRRCDLIFLQNGILKGYLKQKGLEENTQGLVYFAVSKLGEAPIDGKTDMNPDGLTAVTGKWGRDMAARLAKADLACKVLDKEPWNVAMLEKHIWICAFMAVGSQYEGCTVGDVEKDHKNEVKDIIAELAAAASWETGCTFKPNSLEELLLDMMLVCLGLRSAIMRPALFKVMSANHPFLHSNSFSAVGKCATDRA